MKEELKEDRREEADSLERKLHQVIALPNVSDIVNGLIRWFNASSEEDVELDRLCHP